MPNIKTDEKSWGEAVDGFHRDLRDAADAAEASGKDAGHAVFQHLIHNSFVGGKSLWEASKGAPEGNDEDFEKTEGNEAEDAENCIDSQHFDEANRGQSWSESERAVDPKLSDEVFRDHFTSTSDDIDWEEFNRLNGTNLETK